ncbi:MAG: glycosyltransferase family 2 protein [bacterium]|nr:glycosyltransferase family 2 protein [bacterium]
MIYILLPAYNEEENILTLLCQSDDEAAKFYYQESEPYPVHAVVVNDGSHDATHDEAASFTGAIQVTVLDHEKNRGLAAALRTGLDFILQEGEDDDFVLTLDADGTHKPEYLFKLVNKLSEGYDVVVASRYAPGGKEIGVNVYRRLLSMGARVCYRTFFSQVPLRDFSCGFRGFRLSVLRKTVDRWGARMLEMPGFACTGELMLKALVQTEMHRVTEIPFELHYEAKGGSSKMPALKTVLGTVQLLFKARGWLKDKPEPLSEE